MRANAPDNPFPLEAVATWGRPLVASARLRYMELPKAEVDSYLTAYPMESQRYGGAIGVRGGHGSGKTHLAIWLGQKAREAKSLEPEVLYAKADSSSLFDLYLLVLGGLTRARIQRVIHQALRNVAVQWAQRAAATEELADRIVSPSDLPKLYEEQNLSPEHLLSELHDRLKESNLPDIVPRTLLAVDDLARGELAYRWLLGETVDPKADQELSRPLRTLSDSEGSPSSDGAAANALEALAALYSVAEIPLLLIIDQLEVLLTADEERLSTLHSVLKKLVEQAGSQKALVVLIGADRAWAALPRDVTPRFRTREPLGAGALTVEETKLLLDSRSGGHPAFTEKAASWIGELSGGNPREILRIAHEVFEDTDGNLDTADYNTVLSGALATGTVSDRVELMLSIADPILDELGEVAKNVELGSETVLRLLLVERVPKVALVVARATDRIGEVDSAQRVAAVRQELEQEWPGAALLTISVGYSSHEVEDLLVDASHVMRFDEENFASALHAQLLKFSTRRDVSVPSGAELHELIERLTTLGAQRQADENESTSQFTNGVASLAEKRRAAYEGATRWELLDRIDELEDLLSAGNVRGERELMRSILVANETSLRLSQVNSIGGAYMDMLGPEDSKDSRRLLLKQLRRALRSRSVFNTILNRPVYTWVLSLFGSFVISAAYFAYQLIVYVNRYDSTSEFFRYNFPDAASIFGFIAVLVSIVLLQIHMMQWFRLRKIEMLEKRENGGA